MSGLAGMRPHPAALNAFSISTQRGDDTDATAALHPLGRHLLDALLAQVPHELLLGDRLAAEVAHDDAAIPDQRQRGSVPGLLMKERA